MHGPTSRSAAGIAVNSSAVSMQSSETPWMTSARKTGTPVARDMPSAPVITTAKKIAAGNTPSGLSRASMATTMPV